MIPFWLEARFYRCYVFLLKIFAIVYPIRQPLLFKGDGAVEDLAESIVADDIKHVLLVTDAQLVSIGLIAGIETTLKNQGIQATVYDGVLPDPTIEQIEGGVERLKQSKAEAVLAVGGGSSIDAAKVIAARGKNDKSILAMDGMFKVSRGMMPMFAIPTTAGTGSEVTVGAVVSDPETTRKFVVIDPRLVPHKAALDGSLMVGMPAPITAATGMDALTHAIEAYISTVGYSATHAHALEAAQLIMRYLPRAVANGTDLEARHKMAEASHLAGLAITRAGVGYVHAISHNLAARYHTPHGLTNAIVMPYVLDYSKTNCAGRLAELAKQCGIGGAGDSDMNRAEQLIQRIRDLNAEFGIPTNYEALQAAEIPAIATAALKEARFTYGVPRYLNQQGCEQLIAQLA